MSSTYTTALEIIQDTIFPEAWTPPPGWVDASGVDQATNGPLRARLLPGAELAPSGAGPSFCAWPPELGDRRSLARPRLSVDRLQSQPAPPLRSADRWWRRRRVGGGQVWSVAIWGRSRRDPRPQPGQMVSSPDSAL